MGKVIDSSVLIAAERGQLDLRAALSDHRDDSFAISAITASELLHGVLRTPARKRTSTEAFVEGLLRGLPVLPFDLLAAQVHARLWVDSVAKGRAIGERDLLIAATAVAHDCSVITRDERSFRWIAELAVERW